VTEHNESILKHKLLDACRELIEKRIETATTAMNDAQRSANEEGKSSAGDKYETGRAMMQIERDKAANQLEEALKLKRTIDQIRPDVQHEIILPGSVVFTDLFKAFIAIGAGKINVDGEDFLVVGPQSPLGKELVGRKLNDHFQFNNRSNRIIKIF
jgi:hypothetical protein